MGEGIVLAKGVPVRTDKRNRNTKGSSDVISNGSIIHVNQNQFMMLVDGGKIIDYTAEPGYFKVDNSSAPSLFSGGFGDALKETFSRFKFGGTTPMKQEVFYINLQEIKGIKFGTPNPLQYFDNFYNAELFLRAFGNYSIKITDPIKFFKEACPRNATHVHIDEINEQYLTEFLEALQAAISQMSMEGERISFIPSKGTLLSKHMSQILDDSWKDLRGMEVLAVGIASITYDDSSKELINMRNKGAMLGDPSIREGFVQGSIARGMEAAGSNQAGAGMAFMGMGMGMNADGNFTGQASPICSRCKCSKQLNNRLGSKPPPRDKPLKEKRQANGSAPNADTRIPVNSVRNAVRRNRQEAPVLHAAQKSSREQNSVRNVALNSNRTAKL